MSSEEAEDLLQVQQINRLLQLVEKEDKERIEKMVKHGVENLINLTEPLSGEGALHVAVSAFKEDIVRFLVSKGAHFNIQDKQGRTPVMLAAELGNDVLMALMTPDNADLSLQDAEGKGVLFYCIYPTRRHTRCLQLALKHQADVNNISTEGTHIFQLMCEKTCTPMCVIMLDAGTDPNATNQKTGVTALMEAAKADCVELVRAILKKGGNPNALDKKHFTAVHYAAMRGSLEVIQVLSAYSAEMGVINLENCTPLHYAAVKGNANCCKFLAQRGCNPKLKNQDGLLPRQVAKNVGNTAAAKELRDAEKKQDKKSIRTKLMSDPWALTLHDWSNEFEAELRQAFGKQSDRVTEEKFSSVLKVLKAPVEPDQLQRIITAHDNRKDGYVNINDFIKGVNYINKSFLLSSYAPKLKNELKGAKGAKGAKGGKKKEKFPPLPIRFLPPLSMPRLPDGGRPVYLIEKYYNNSDILRFNQDNPPQHPLMDDSKWYMEKPEVYTNINTCVTTGDLDSLALAFRKGVSVNVQDPYYRTPLITACSNGNYKMAEYLISKGADVNMHDHFLWTPLHHAADGGYLELIKLLLESGAIIEAQALGGGTPLMKAIQASRPMCVDFLINVGANVEAKNKRGQNCLDIAKDFADLKIIHLINDRMDSLPKQATKKGGKVQKPKSSKDKEVAAEGTKVSTAAVRDATFKDSKSIIAQNTMITTGKTNTVDVSFVPETVWGKPATTSHLMSKIERRKQLLSLEVDFDDFMAPFSQNILKTMLELRKNRD